MKFFKLFFLFFIPLSLFSENLDKDILKDFFAQEYTVSDNPLCKPQCRALRYDDRFIAKIVDFDASTGITTCEVFPKASGDNQLAKLSIDANTQNETCLEKYNAMQVNYESDDLESKDFKVDESIRNLGEYDKSKLTMSRFIGGLATLDNEVINIIETQKTGYIEKENTNHVYSLDSDTNTDDSDRLLNSIDRLSSTNLGYYVDLFYSMDTIYEYMVAYVFVFISLFFMLLYTSKIALKKIAKKTTAFDEPWQTKLAIVVFSTVIFFIPMKLNDDYSSTLFQNIWKYFVQESTSIADKANTIGMKTYMKKVYNTTGISGVETEANLKLLNEQQVQLKDTYNKALEECKDRYQTQITFQNTNAKQIKEIEEQTGAGDDTLTFRGCRAIEKKYKIALTGAEQTQHTLLRIEKAYSDDSEDSIKARLVTMTEHLNKRIHELGWYSAVLAPTLQVLTKISFLQGSKVTENVNDKFKGYINTAAQATISKQDEIKNQKSFEDLLNTQVRVDKKNNTEKALGEALSNVSFLSLVPGASSIKDFIDNLSSNDIEAIYNKVKTAQDGNVINKLPPNSKSLSFTSTLIKYILEALPFITTFIAVGIVVIMYIYELIVFSFISPFIVAFSVTTGQSRKILDFLVTALTLFLKPTIIVVAIYLALFLYSIFQDIFVLMADEQFYLSLASTTDFLPSLIFYFVKEMLFIFAVFASVFFMWKLVMEMPDFIFKKIGLTNLSSTSQMANSMQQSFGKFGFRA